MTEESGPQRPIRLVVAGHDIVRAGLKAVLEVEPDLEVVGLAGPGDDVLALVEQVQPDVVLLHPGMPTSSGPDLCARLVELHPALRVLIVSTYAEMDLVRACIAAGAHGYIIKSIDGRELTQAVRDLYRGEISVTSAVAGRFIDQMGALVRVRTRPDDWRSGSTLPAASTDDELPAAPLRGVPRLTGREQQVLARLLDGERVPVIAADLFVSQSTVRNHLSSIFKKVGVHSQAELIHRVRAGRNGSTSAWWTS